MTKHFSFYKDSPSLRSLYDRVKEEELAKLNKTASSPAHEQLEKARQHETILIEQLEKGMGGSGDLMQVRKEIADLEKEVSNEKKASISPSASFDENLLKLSSALRARDLDTYANALEEKFINYKIAKSNPAYNVFKETGDSFLKDAHPEKSPDLVDSKDGLGEVETLVDQHQKIVDILKKEPTGKYVSAADQIVNQVKLVLAQDANAMTVKYLTELNSVLDSGLASVKDSGLSAGAAGTDQEYAEDMFEDLKKNSEDLIASVASLTNEQASRALDDLRTTATHAYKLFTDKFSKNQYGTKDREALAKKVVGLFSICIAKINAANWALNNELEGADFQARQLDSQEFMAPTEALQSKLHNFHFLMNKNRNDQNEGTINKIQAVADNATDDLTHIVDFLRVKPTVAFSELQNILKQTHYLKKISNPDDFSEALKQLETQIFTAVQNLNA